MPYITVKSPLSGQLGNQFFQVNLAVQIAKILDSKVRIAENNVLSLCEKSQLFEKKSLGSLRFRKVYSISKEYILNEDTTSIISLCRSVLSRGKILEFPSGMLGEVFHKFLRVQPRDIFKPKIDYRFSPDENSDSGNRVALHFRGADFQSWNPSYVMETTFYLRALEYLNLSSEYVDLYTDDTAHPTVIDLKRLNVVGEIYCNKDFGIDFWKLSQYRTIVISPSTFAVWASILGVRKSIYYDKNWFLRDVSNETFWRNFTENQGNLMDKIIGI
jgi:hypothetical protein